MKSIAKSLGCLLLLSTSLFVGNQAGATSMVRMDLEDLVRDNAIAVMGEVTGLHAYWNQDASFILTDVTVRISEPLKGEKLSADQALTFTVMGGTVGELTNLIVAGPELVKGGNYVLFLNREDLPGAHGVLTTRELSQGVFDIIPGKDGELRAVSQANSHPLFPDTRGHIDAAGGEQGFELDTFFTTVRQLDQRIRAAGKEAQ